MQAFARRTFQDMTSFRGAEGEGQTMEGGGGVLSPLFAQ